MAPLFHRAAININEASRNQTGELLKVTYRQSVMMKEWYHLRKETWLRITNRKSCVIYRVAPKIGIIFCTL